MSPVHRTLAAAVVVAAGAAQSAGILVGDAPSVHAPLPISLLFVPVTFQTAAVVVVVPALLFLAWNPSLFRGDPVVPVRTNLLFGAMVVASAWYYCSYWRLAVTYQGVPHLLGCLMLNLLFILATSAVLLRNRSRQSPTCALVGQTLLFVWLLSYAMPYFGEGI